MARHGKRNAHRHNQQSENKFSAYQKKEYTVVDNVVHIARKDRVDLIPKNNKQEEYVDCLLDPNIRITVACGPAGTGKTLLAVTAAIKALKDRKVSKIIISRPAVSVDEEHGFLPGTLNEKMEPWTRPIMDVFEEYWHPVEIQKMLESRVIEICPLAYMRGRSFHNAYIVLDESQNTTPNQMKMALTRLGRNSYMSVTGDIDQHDRGYEENGLKDFIQRLESKRSRKISLTWFDKSHVERDPVVAEVLTIYEE